MHVARPLIAALALACALSVATAQQPWPSRNVHFIVPFAPAGPADIIARLVGNALQTKWGQTVVVENRAGGGGTTGTVVASRAEPDGYTVLAHSSAYAVNVTLFEKPGYALTDFQAVAAATTAPNILIATNSLKYNTLPEIIAAAKTEQFAYASPSTGTTPHLTSELVFRMIGKVDVRHVPFTGAAPAVNAVMAGHVPFAFVSLAGALEQIKAKSVKAIAVASAKRLPELPDVPTIKETGVGDVEAASDVWFLMPARTPRAIVDKFNADFIDIVRSGAIDKGVAATGSTALTYDAARAQAYIEGEAKKWGEVIRAAGIKAE